MFTLCDDLTIFLKLRHCKVWTWFFVTQFRYYSSFLQLFFHQLTQNWMSDFSALFTFFYTNCSGSDDRGIWNVTYETFLGLRKARANSRRTPAKQPAVQELRVAVLAARRAEKTRGEDKLFFVQKFPRVARLFLFA